MGIVIKTKDEIETMKRSCRLAADVLVMIEPHIKVGITTLEIDQICHDFIIENGAIPSCLNYKGYPKSTCTSVNHVVCHGIPDAYRLREGDIINVDVTTFLDGFHGDNSKTYLVGKTSRAARDIVQAAEDAMWAGIRAVKPGATFGDLGFAVQSFVEAKGYSVVREYGGHGIGRVFHEDPHVAHFGRKGTGPKILPGMVFTVEPMVNQGKREVILLEDDWTVETEDEKLSAQFEHTIAVHDDGVEVLTFPSNHVGSRFV
ncbi:MAG: type I methionyl aminopeptidase [Bdellovibrionota bacterium]